MSEKSIKGRLRSQSKTDQKETNMAVNPSATGSQLNGLNNLKEQMLSETEKLFEKEEVSVQGIWNILKSLAITVNEIKQDTTEAKGTQQSITSLWATNTTLANRLDQVEELLAKTITKVNLIGNLVIRQEERFEALQNKVKSSRKEKTKANLIVRGIVEVPAENDQVRRQAIKRFIK